MATYQLLQSSGGSVQPATQSRQAPTFILIILLIGFATLVSYYRLTSEPTLSGQAFVQPTNAFLAAHRQRLIEARFAGVPAPVRQQQHGGGNKQPNTILDRTPDKDAKVYSKEASNAVGEKKPEAVVVPTSKLDSSSAAEPRVSSSSSQDSTSSNSNAQPKNASSAVVAVAAAMGSAVTGLIADQQFEKEYRDDPVTQAQPVKQPQVKRKPKLVFDQSDLVFTQKLKIDKPEACGEADGAYADLVVLVNSAVYNFDARAAIRDTWGRFAVERGAYFYFLIGSTDDPAVQARVETEDERHDDILQGDFYDSYHNLTLKTITMMRWVAEKCSKIRYVLKVDDDMMLNMQHVCDFAEINPNFHKVIIGKLAKKWKPHRDHRNKWYVPTEAYNGTYFPNFVTGPAYFFTGDAAKPLYETAIHETRPFYLEDVYMTGVVAEKANIKRFNHAMMRNIHLKIDECTFWRMMTSHKYKPPEIRAMWRQVYSTKCVVKPTKSPSTRTTASTGAKTANKAAPGPKTLTSNTTNTVQQQQPAPASGVKRS